MKTPSKLAELLLRAKERNTKQANRQFVSHVQRNCERDLLKQAGSLVKDRNQAKDLVQNLYVKLLETDLRIIRAQTEEGIICFLKTALRHLAYDSHKSYYRRNFTSLNERSPEPTHRTDTSIELQMDVQHLLSNLNDKDRAIMQDVSHGYTHDEIAQRWGLGKRAVPSRVSRIRKGIRSQYAG